MSRDWLDEDEILYERDRDTTPTPFIISIVPQLPAEIRGGVANIFSQTRKAYSWLLVSPKIDAEVMAKLLALALLDRQFQILEPTLMPSRPPLAVLRDDGRFRHQLTRTFAPWAEAEIGRLTGLLQRDGELLGGELCSGKASDLLSSVPRDFPLRDESGLTFATKPPTVHVRTSGYEKANSGLVRHEHIRKEYERDRYLLHLTKDDLRTRTNDILRNLHQIDSRGRVTLEFDERIIYWIDRFTELIHEVGLRGLGPTFLAGAYEGVPLPYPTVADRFREIGDAVSTREPPSLHLVKYGEASHLKEALLNGRIRLGPASNYVDSSLNVARFADELVHTIDLDISVLPQVRHGVASFRGSAKGRVTFTSAQVSDYLVYCLSGQLRARLFADFDAEACLLIHEPDQFRERFGVAAASKLPGWTVEATRVEYYDPLNIAPGEIQPFFSKQFGYAYQEEVRFACVPPKAVNELTPVFLNLGPLNDIAYLLTPGERAE